MIQPNFDLMLWIIFILFCVKGLALIVAGSIGLEKEKKYDGGSVIAGIIWLIIMAFVVFK